MPSPFPGMDPWLETSWLFPDLHASLITYLREALNAALPAGYYAGSNERVWVEESDRGVVPDVDVVKRPGPAGNGSPGAAAGAGGVAVLTAAEPVVIPVALEERRETFLEVREVQGGRLVTSVEILSPSNKTSGSSGRELYLQKQREVLRSQVHFVEIDLLRGGTHTTAVSRDAIVARAGLFDYHVCVRRFDRRDAALVYPIRLDSRLPVIAMPLLTNEPGIPVDLQPLLDRCYDSGRYGDRVVYTDPPPPPWSPQQQAWAEGVLRARGLLPPAGA